MRYVLAVLAAVALLSVPGLGQINVTLVADSPVIGIGQQTQVHVWAQGSGGGLAALGGSVVASGDAALETVAGSFSFVPSFLSWEQYDPGDGSQLFPPAVGAAGVNGGWSGFGSMQTALPLDEGFARLAAVEIASYTVEGLALGTVSLSFVGGEFGNFMPLECNESLALGTLTGATITVVPEPVTLALLAVGGLAMVRRRR